MLQYISQTTVFSCNTCVNRPTCEELFQNVTYAFFIFYFLMSAVNQLSYHRLTTLCDKLEVSDTLVSMTCAVLWS